MRKDYTIGLDIGTNSVGYSVIYDDYNVPSKKVKVLGNTDKKYKKKNLIGVELFDEGKTAADRRIARTTRRRYTRRRNRLNYLREIFSNEIGKIDESFFHRLDESFFTEDDKKFEKYTIFKSEAEEREFHNKFKTIYHLRKHLIETDEKADIRLIYLALAHIVKFRGNFLIEGELNLEDISVNNTFKKFVDEFNKVIYLDNSEEYIDNSIDVSKILTSKVSKTKKVEEVVKLYKNQKANGKFGVFLKYIVGNQGNFKSVFNLDDEAKIQIPSSSYEDDLDDLLSIIGDDYIDLFLSAFNVYNAIILSDIFSEDLQFSRSKLSDSMINKYNEHNSDLKKFKKYINKNFSKQEYNNMFRDEKLDGYAGYIEGKTTQEKFYKYIKNKLSEREDAQYFIEKIDSENFLKKQRSYENGSIPNQVHLSEFRSIIKNQGVHYPFLKDNLNKMCDILTFRIPYYVGPLDIGPRVSSEFSWLTRKEGNIRPWNFDDLVDINKSSISFIERMTLNDTYLSNEKVLPKNSIIYQKYMIFNELTKVSYIDKNGKRNLFDAKVKLKIFNNLFKKYRKVTGDKLKKYLQLELGLNVVSIEGIEESFNSNFSVYHDLYKINEVKNILDCENISNDVEESLEEIIKILTIFDDKKMKRKQLEKFNKLFKESTLNDLSKKNYTGWGRLSKKLINGIVNNASGKTILDYLMDDDGPKGPINRNFMQLINDDDLIFKKVIDDENKNNIKESIEETVYKIAGSPAIKKGILQSLKIVDELVKVMGYAPKNIVIEMARENQTTDYGKKQSRERFKKIEEGIKRLESELLKENPLTNKNDLQSEKLYLYYLQNGKDMYTGDEIDINKLSSYDVDHIIPRSFIVDNSIDNKVLVSDKKNRLKTNDVPSIDIVNKMIGFWKKLKECGLISERKFSNLTKSLRGGLTDDDKAGFIKRQLVETRQITKNVARILDERFNLNKENKHTKIITLKSAMVSEFRETFEIYKVREINNFHHAHDAYLNAVIGISLLKVYPKLMPEFVYGEYTKINLHNENKATARKNLFSNLMRFFSKDTILNSGSGEILWDRDSSLHIIKKVIYNSQINIVKKTEIQKGAFSNLTAWSKKEKGVSIERKKGLDILKYGGFDNPKTAFAVAVKYIDKNKEKIKLVSISILEKDDYCRNETEFLKSKGFNNIKYFYKLPKYTLFEFDDGKQRYVASGNELQKANNFVLSEKFVKLIYHCIKCEDIDSYESVRYLEDNRYLFKELFEIVCDFSSKYLDAESNLNIIKQIFEAKNNENIKVIAKSFVNLMSFTSTGAASAFKFFDKDIDRKRYNSTSECSNGVIVFKSCTGIFETRIDLRK